MKKGRGLARAVAPMSRQELECLSTGASLARLKHLRWCEERRSESDLSDEEVAAASALILFKDSAAWRAAYDDLEALLPEREHLAGKP